MINFRFHLVSLIAIFLALAVGIVVGSTVIDQAIVDGLRDQIDRVEEKADARKVENDGLKDEIARITGYVEGSAPFVVEGRLEGVPVVVLAERGVDEREVDAVIDLVQAAGAEQPFVVWLERGWNLDDEEKRQALGDLVGRDDDPDALREKAFAALVAWFATSGNPDGVPAEGEAPTEQGSGRTTGGGSDDEADGEAQAATSTTDATMSSAAEVVLTESALIRGLAEAEFVTIDRRGDAVRWPGDVGVRALLVTGSTSVLTTASALAEALVSSEVPTVAAEVYMPSDGGGDRGAALTGILGDDVLADAVTTVDDLEFVEGRVSAVIGLQELADGKVGHYGYGGRATRSLPEWTAR